MQLEDKVSAAYKGHNFKTDKLTSVVILSMNRYDDLKANIESLYKHTTLPFEVIILDNGSTQQNTIKYLQKINGKTKQDGNGRIKVIFKRTNLGCSAGRNEAIKQVSPNASYIATIDNDITYTKGWLEELIRAVESDSQIGAACAKVVLPEGDIQLTGGKIQTNDKYYASFRQINEGKRWDSNDTNRQEECDWLPGGAMLIKKGVADLVEHAKGYLNGFEDYDYSLQIRKKGYKLVSAPESILIHHHIMRDKGKQEREKDYLRHRWDHKLTFESMLLFLERTGLNLVKDTCYYGRNWEGPKDFLEPYPEEQARMLKPYEQYSDAELKEHFERLLTVRKQRRKALPLEQLFYYHHDMFAKGFQQYNLTNLASHLVWRLPNERYLTLEQLFMEELLNHGVVKDRTIVEKLAQELARKYTIACRLNATEIGLVLKELQC